MENNLMLAIITSIMGVCITVLGFIFILIKKHKRLLQQQQALADAALQHQENLLQAIIQSQEEEGRRIGDDLHDQVGVALAALQMMIEKQSISNASLVQFERSKEIINNVMSDVRRISHNLAPDINSGDDIHAALDQLVDYLNSSGSIKGQFTIRDDNNQLQHIPQNKAISIYRVMAELLHNGIRHSHGSSMEISITSLPTELELIYKDDGVGMNIAGFDNKSGIGYRNIRSRLATMNASWLNETNPGSGFQCRMLVPC